MAVMATPPSFMHTELLTTRVLLLVEDNPADAEFAAGLLENGPDSVSVVRVGTVAKAVEHLRGRQIDVVVLDLRLPDCDGVETVKAVHRASPRTPVVVLTGGDDADLALACIAAGAQDYLSKNELNAQNLKRAVGYAMSRIRDAQLREMQDVLRSYRGLSTQSQSTTVTATLVGSGAITLRNPRSFAQLLHSYYELFRPYLLGEEPRREPTRIIMEELVTRLGDMGGGPRDLLDLHLAALEQMVVHAKQGHSSSIMFEARLIVLEMMGLLVDYYRVGLRRYSTEGSLS